MTHVKLLNPSTFCGIDYFSPVASGTCSDCGGALCSKCGKCHYCDDVDLPCRAPIMARQVRGREDEEDATIKEHNVISPCYVIMVHPREQRGGAFIPAPMLAGDEDSRGQGWIVIRPG